ncbi:MAG: outer membrane lipoprotein-sorting protein [Polyangiales bacterium]
MPRPSVYLAPLTLTLAAALATPSTSNAAPPTAAASASTSADAIVARALARDALGLEGGHATVTLNITNDDGSTESKTLEIWSRKKDGLLQSRITFRAPAKLAGMSFLLLQRRGQTDEQYVYLPSFKKSRRVTAAERTTAFAGSDFTYADLEHRETVDATYTRLADDTIDGKSCAVVDAVPTASAASAYKHVKLWLRASDDAPVKTEFYGADGGLEKTLVARAVEPVEGRSIVTKSRLERAGSKRATEIVVDKASFKETLADALFTVGSLDSGG